MSRIHELFRALGNVYGRDLTDEALERLADAWWPYDEPRLERAIREALVTSKFMPTVGDLKALVATEGPNELIYDIQNELLRREGFGAGLPSQRQIDEILVEWGLEPGLITARDMI